jgi:cation transport regulator ChaB
MPYSSNADLPKAVRDKLSPHQQSVFRNVFNSMMEQEGMSESRAFAGAYSQAKQAVEKVNTDILRAKAEEHNEKYGDKGRVTVETLRQVYDRGVGAYRTNPGSVRPNVSSPEQWAMARVNNFLRAIRNGRFRSGKHDTDLLPSKHPMASGKVEKAEYQGREVELDKPFRMPAGSTKKFGVYVKDGDKVKKVTFGDPNMEIRRDDADARRNFRSRHSCDAATDKTTPRYWSCRMWEEGTSVSEMTNKAEVQIEGQILKQMDEERLAFGWAYVSTVKGEVSLDHSGEFIRPDQIAKAATNFMLSMRTAKAMHTGEKIGEVVHSMPLTNDIAKALGIQSDREGWVIALKVYDDQVWQDVKSGKLAAFSIGGRALKEMV